MDKKILNQYIDAIELIKETEEEILRLEAMQTQLAQDTVMGSNPEFPYQRKHFKVEGVIFRTEDASRLIRQRELLMKRRQQAEEVKLEVEEWMSTLPLRMQRIIRYRYFKGCTWQEVARRMGRKATSDSVRKEFENLFKK